jgi:hypothetical protein
MKQIDKNGVHAVMIGDRVALTLKNGRRLWTGLILDFGAKEVVKRQLDTPKKATDFLHLKSRPKSPMVDAKDLERIG